MVSKFEIVSAAITLTQVSFLFMVNTACFPAKAEGPGDFVVAPTHVGSFELAGPKRIWKSIYNKPDNQKEWQFQYDCLFTPEARPNGKLATTIVNLPRSFQVSVPIRLNSARAKSLALSEINRLYDTPVRAGQVIPLMVSTLEIDIPGLSRQIPTATLVNRTIGFALPTDSFSIFIETASAQDAQQVVSYLNSGGAQINYKMSFTAKKQSENYIQVTYQDLRNSKLFVELNGLTPANQVAYVHRNDMRKLMEGLHKKIKVKGVIENPAQFDANVFTTALSNLTSGANTTLFDETKWKSTYHGDDLRPNKISSELNKIFTKESGTDNWKRDTTVKVGASASFLGIGGSANVDTNFSSESLRSWLKDNGVESQFNGEKIEVKSIDLRQTNLSDFKNEGEFTSQLTYVEEIKDPISGSMQLVSNQVSVPDFQTRLRATETASSPVGAVIAVAGPGIPSGDWMICDGSELSAESYPELFKTIGTYWGRASEGRFKLPDLRGLFLRGLDTAAATIDKDLTARIPRGTGKPIDVGSYQDDATRRPNTPFDTDTKGDHYHLDPTWNGIDGGSFELASKNGNRHVTGYDYDPPTQTSSAGNHSHSVTAGGDSETRPKNVAINWVIRVR